VEFTGGYRGYIYIHELYFYIFDAIMMFLVQVVYNFIHPGVITDEKQASQIYPSTRDNSARTPGPIEVWNM